MRRIRRAVEPERFRGWREANPAASWESFKDQNRGPGSVADEVYTALANAQMGLCAYCEIDLHPPLGAEVEHVYPKSKSTADHNWGLDFNNFVADCEGAQRPKELPHRSQRPLRENLHCGARKADQDLTASTLDPREIPGTPPLWRLALDGELLVDTDACARTGVDPGRARGTLIHLGLNAPVLKRLRRAAKVQVEDTCLARWDGTDEGYPAAWREVAPGFLDPLDGRLAPFWTTLRLALGDAAEAHLVQHPHPA